MKKKLFILCAALVWTVALMAQSIAVVTANGITTLVRTLDEAIAVVNENDGCVVYLPGGGFPVSDDSKITKKVTIIGIGHKANNDNVDGITTISGNLWFNEGSSGSAVMGCYITGNVNIGDGGATVNDVLIKYCNLNSVQVNNSTCMETIANQNYIRNNSRFNGSKAIIINNIVHSITDLDNGKIAYNILAKTIREYGHWSWGTTTLHCCDQTQIINNIVLPDLPDGLLHECSNCEVLENMTINDSYGENKNWNDYFVEYNQGEISPFSNFHFTADYKQYESELGIYADTGFNDQQIVPVPFIVAKRIDEQTDASGRLNVKIRVKAGGE